VTWRKIFLFAITTTIQQSRITRNKGLIALYYRRPYTMYIIIVILQLYLTK